VEQVRAKLSPSEQQQLMIVFAATTPEQLVDVASELAAKPVDETVASIRGRLAPAGKE
jgi:hypothetical protein